MDFVDKFIKDGKLTEFSIHLYHYLKEEGVLISKVSFNKFGQRITWGSFHLKFFF